MNDSDLIKISLSDQLKFRLNEINKIKDYFNSEIKEREALSKKLGKYIVVFDHADKIFVTLSASFGISSIISHSTVNETIVDKKEKYEQMKENIRNTKSGRDVRENNENTEI